MTKYPPVFFLQSWKMDGRLEEDSHSRCHRFFFERLCVDKVRIYVSFRVCKFMYTLENWHGIPKWRFGRWFSFSIFWGFLGSSLIFMGVNITFKQKTSGQGSTLHEQVLWSSEFWINFTAWGFRCSCIPTNVSSCVLRWKCWNYTPEN